MLVSIAFLAKCFRANRTRKRFVARMYSLVILQCIRAMETLAAAVALVSSFAAMNESVLIEYGSGQEFLVTFFAVVRPFAGMTLANVII